MISINVIYFVGFEMEIVIRNTKFLETWRMHLIGFLYNIYYVQRIKKVENKFWIQIKPWDLNELYEKLNKQATVWFKSRDSGNFDAGL